MINKIKDKQTGEVYDIGGLKCKLVAEGTMECFKHSEEGVTCYKPIYNFEEGKTYFIFIESNKEEVQFIGTKYKNMLRTQFAFDYTSDLILCLLANEDNNIYLFDINITLVEGYEDFPYKVYELPFALEV